MRVPFLDLKANAASVKKMMLDRAEEIIDEASFVGGKYVNAFEERFANMHDTKHCICVNSGTAGNHLALWSLGIGIGDEVIVPVNTFVATAWGVTLCGATPVFVDNDALSYTIDVEKIVPLITARTKAIVAVHLYGQPAEMERIMQIAQAYGLYVIEDAAQAHLATYRDRFVGGLGVVSSFSFYPGKNLGAFGEGGALLTNDDTLASKIRAMRDHGSRKKYYHTEFGHNYRMSHLVGASLEAKVDLIEEWTAQRRENAARYAAHLSLIEEIVCPMEMPYAGHVWHLYVIRTPQRDALATYLQSQGIGVGMHYPVPLHKQPVFSYLNYVEGDFPVAEEQADTLLSLPMFPELKEKQIAYVSAAIKRFFKERS